jgi:hypothetical protein
MSCSCNSYSSFVGNINCPTIPLPNLGLPCCGPTCSSYPCGNGVTSCVSNSGGTDTSCIVYSGPQLNCSGILSGMNLSQILGQIDSQLCNSIGNISSFNTACLAPISTLQQFIETISPYVCNTQSQVTTFIGTTFPAYQTTVTNALNAITNPALTLCNGVTPADSLNTVLTKLANSICTINTSLSLPGVNWSSCFTVSPSPTNITDGFNTVLNQICQLNTLVTTMSGNVLPTFNTTGSCLPSPSTTDTLVSTVNKLITRTCQAPTFDINALTWTCTTKPSTTTTDLQNAFQAVLNKIDSISQTLPVAFSGDFVITNVSNTNLCLGKQVALATPSAQDRFVASNNLDTSPGTLQDKLVSGTDINLDYTTTPGQVIVNYTGVGTSDHKVVVSSFDGTPDYLFNKVENGVANSGIQVTPILDSTTNRVQFNVAVDLSALFTALLNQTTLDPTLKTLLCNTLGSCPSPCSSPTNVTVTYSSAPSTTTTTTTT